MCKNLRFCYRVDKEAGLAEDENGNPSVAFICCMAKDVKTYTLSEETYKELQESLRRIASEQLECDINLITPVTINEYLDETDTDI